MSSTSEYRQTEHLLPDLSAYDQRMRVLELTVQLLIARTNSGDYWPEGIHDVEHLLGAIPIPTMEFVAANGHLHNALSYCEQEEFGAATFELRALRGQLNRI